MANVKTEIVSLSEYVFERTLKRLDALTDAEYFWEPVHNCCTIRCRGDGGRYIADPPESRGGSPFTTIAWRLWHLIGCYGASRNAAWLGVQRPATGFDPDDPAPGTADQAAAALNGAHTFWRDLLNVLPVESWWEPVGSIGGPYAESNRLSFVLHQVDEQIHHGAELGVLRDLYSANVA